MRSADYVQETTTSIAGTNGNGAVTLAAISGFPRMSNVFGTSARTVRYVIEDTVANKFESGIGSVSANVLTRTHPQVTWDGTTWSDGSAGTVAALAFGSTPTSGNVVIRLAPTAEVASPVMPARQSTIAGDSAWRDYPLSAAFGGWTGNGTGANLTAGTEYYYYYKLDTAGLLTGIQAYINGAAGTTLKMALYDINSSGLPGSKIVDFAGISTATTGLKTDTATASWTPAGGVWLTPGWYAIGYISDGAPGLIGSPGNQNGTQPTPLGRKNAYGYSSGISNAGSYASGLPAAPSLGSAMMLDPGGTALANPWIGLKVVA